METIRENSAGLGGLWKPPSARRGRIVRGQQAVPFFQKSGLPDTVLGGRGDETHFAGAISQAVALSNLNDETQLPDMKGVDLAQVFAQFGASAAGLQFQRILSSASAGRTRRDSTSSSAGWPNVAGSAGAGDDSAAGEITVLAREKQQYQQIFEKSQPIDGAISSAAAKALFMKTKLTNEQLGTLRLPGFIVAMFYIRRIMENRNYSSLMNGSSADLALTLASPAQWDVTNEERVRYRQFFDSLDTQKAGFLSGDVPVNFFLKSNLPEMLLSKVWDLADVNHNGKLSREEFAVAMHLINLRLAGGEIPDTLPPALVPPSMRKVSITSNSMHNLSPQIRPASARSHLQYGDNLKRAPSYAPHVRGPMPISRSPAPLSPVYDDSEISGLQTQLGQMEDMSRGLQMQRTNTANQIAISGSRKQELEVKISALHSSQEAETRINQELRDKLKVEEDRVGEASRVLSVVSAQRSALEQEVHRVQTQQLALQQRLQQAQEDSRQLYGEVAELDQHRSIAAMQSQISQQEETNRALSEKAEGSRRLTQTSSSLSQKATSLSQANSQSNASFGETFQAITAPQDQLATAENREAHSSIAEIPATFSPVAGQQQQQRSVSPAAILHRWLLSPAMVAPVAQIATSTNAFDSFGSHEADPFEEFLTAATSSKPTSPLSIRSTSNLLCGSAIASSPIMAKSTPASPFAYAASAKSSEFAADFGSAFDLLPGSAERAIKKDMEKFDEQFPEINTSPSAPAVPTVEDTEGVADLTFESVFGSGDKVEQAAAPATTAKAAEKKSSDSSNDDGFVPPPVVKRINAPVFGQCRECCQCSSSSNNRTSSMPGTPALPPSRDQDKKFEEKWAKGDWPDWYCNERRMLLEMGYSKDRVVEALEVNDFNLAQASDYLLSS
ncbi:hypothetical protein BX661DRAFT_186904 [Kickxella alabastrina]|uniref:uncharacterized protein n=1 Tax=Kickxella alabastrina TaxID=61397 RepID=UPI0022207EFD|nr:uncharacterized protein BX661DRAFT_186904 [Kickxella alabastrina]KAI7823129.1 hypothetical protein BX661DRAFT_186904 [Kickxella alabastrina]